LQRQIYQIQRDTLKLLLIFQDSGFNKPSTVPAGSLSNAALFGANTVKGPSLLKANPAALTAATSVEKSAFPAATPTMFEFLQQLLCLLRQQCLPFLLIQLVSFLHKKLRLFPQMR
jgi:hypothetical protein